MSIRSDRRYVSCNNFRYPDVISRRPKTAEYPNTPSRKVSVTPFGAHGNIIWSWQIVSWEWYFITSKLVMHNFNGLKSSVTRPHSQNAIIKIRCFID